MTNLSVAIALLCGVLGTAEPAAPAAPLLRLRSGTIDPAQRRGLDLRGLPRFDARQRYLLQLAAPLTSEQRAALTAAGVRLEEYLPDNAYVARLANVAPVALRSLAFVRWLDRFDPAWKLDSQFGRRAWQSDERRRLVAQNRIRAIVWSFDGVPPAEFAATVAPFGVALAPATTSGGHARVMMELPAAGVAALAALPDVQFIDEAPEFELRNDRTAWVTQSNVSLQVPLWDRGIHGEGQIGGLIDFMVRESHCMFDDTVAPGPTHRKFVSMYGNVIADSHGTHVCGTFVGDSAPTGGNFCYNGVAFAARASFRLLSQIYISISLYDAFVIAHNDGARVHSNSYGAPVTAYDTTCVDIDRFMRDYEDDLVLFAVANGDINNMMTVKNPENAKNLLAVGATQAPPNQDFHQSGLQGPTSDGRRRPEVYAPGQNVFSANSATTCDVNTNSGTSMATPGVAGTGLLVRQYFTDGFYPSGAANPSDAFVPSGALIKAVLINSAVDMTGISGYPSLREGWGRILADNSLHFAGDARRLWIRDRRNATGFTTTGGANDTFKIENLNTSEPLQITLAFTDVPGTVNSMMPVVNNLNLQVTAPDGTIYKGNVFNTSLGVSQTGGSFDALNNVEQVRVLNPAVGAWTVDVIPAAILGPAGTPKQGYALVAAGAVSAPAPVIYVEWVAPPPPFLPAGETLDVELRIIGGTENLVGGSPTLRYRTTPPGGAFASAALTPLGSNLYRATIPAAACGDLVEFYVTALGSGATTVYFPATAPGAPFAIPAARRNFVLVDDFEVDQGWNLVGGATAGNFERAVPQQTLQCSRMAQAAADHSSGGCTVAAVTVGTAGVNADAFDLDGGTTRLISPQFDLSAFTGVTASMWVWFHDGYLPDDDVTIDVSSNGGANWVPAVTLANGRSAWQYVEFQVEDYIPLTTLFALRVSAADGGKNSTMEVLVDDVIVRGYGCSAAPDCLAGDLTNDGKVDGDDIQPFLNGVYAACQGILSVQELCAIDTNGDGAANTGDIPSFVNCLLTPGGCP